MADLKLTTKRNPVIQEIPPQLGNPEEFFGEQSNDLQFNQINDFDVVEGLDKLKQDINKILFTERGQNTNFPLYGTSLQSLIGVKTNFTTLKSQVKKEIIESLQILYFINKNNPNLDEKPETLEFLSIEQPTVSDLEIKINVITEAGNRLSTGVIFSIQA